MLRCARVWVPLLSVALLIAAGRPARGANCGAFQIILSSQAEVDQFQSTHGPCTALGGQLVVQGPDITNLNGLASLVSVDSLILLSNPMLTSLTGLSSLVNVGTALWVSRSPALVNLAGLQSLKTVGGDLLISENDALTNLDALSSLETVSAGGLYIVNNLALTSVTGLRALRTVGTDLSVNGNPKLATLAGLGAVRGVGGDLIFERNDALTSLAALSSLRTIGRGVRISANPSLTRLGFGPLTSVALRVDISANPVLASLDGLGSITKLLGLSITSCPALTELDDVDSLEEITETLVIQHNAALTDIDGLASIEKIGSIFIADNDSLTNVDGFSGLTVIEGDAQISGPALRSLEGLANVVEVTGELAVGGPMLDNLHGLEAVETVGQLAVVFSRLTTLDDLRSLRSVAVQVRIVGNPALTSLAALHRIEELFGLSIEDNDALVDLRGLEGLERVGFTGVTISDNDSLRSLVGLDSLQVTGSLHIGSAGNGILNRSLSSVDGLESLVSVEQSVFIQRNPLLADLDGLRNLAGVDDLHVISNPRLTDCSGIARLLDAVDDPPPGPGTQESGMPDVRTASVGGNGPGCNSVAEVLASPPDFPCVRDNRTACLLDGRFRVRADMWDFFNAPLGPGTRHPGLVQTYQGARSETDLSVSFYAFEEGNVELFVKMLDACPLPVHTFWVFAAGATTAEAEVEVLDTWTGERFRVFNPRDVRFKTATGTTAFATCDASPP